MLTRTTPLRAALLAALAVLAALSFVLAAPAAQARANFESSIPATGETVPGPVTEIQLVFSAPVALDEAETRVLDANGTDLIYEAFEADDGAVWLLEPALSLDNGVFGVIWQAEASNGNVIRGVIRFGVGDVVLEDADPLTDPGPTQPIEPIAEDGSATSGGGFLGGLGAALANIGVIIGWGVALFVAFITSPRMTWVGRYLLQLMRIAGVIAIVGGVLDLITQFLTDGGVTSILGALLRLAAGAALFAVPGMVNGSPFIWVLSAVVIIAYVLGSNSGSGPTWLMALSGAAHVTFAAIWAGGIVALSTVLALIIRARENREALINDGSELAVRFSRAAMYSVVGVSITGIISAFYLLPSFGDLFSTGWGVLLVVKIVLVIALAYFGFRVHFGAIPEIEYAQVQRDNGDDVEELERSHLKDLRRTLLPQMGLVVVILILSGVLVQMSSGA